jgi:hypothetical protein
MDSSCSGASGRKGVTGLARSIGVMLGQNNSIANMEHFGLYLLPQNETFLHGEAFG